jgi:hypothetical protein
LDSTGELIFNPNNIIYPVPPLEVEKRVFRKEKNMKASENKFLIVRSGVKLTPIIEPVICALDKYYEEFGIKALVTSGLRNPEDQLEIIRSYLVNKGLKDSHPECFGHKVDEKFVVAGKEQYGLLYSWQTGWSKLLSIGVIVNPPLAAHCIYDYMRNGVNKKGLVINGSPHFKGTAFDIGGGADGIATELKPIQKALEDKLPGLINILPERENNAIHCDCIKI